MRCRDCSNCSIVDFFDAIGDAGCVERAHARQLARGNAGQTALHAVKFAYFHASSQRHLSRAAPWQPMNDCRKKRFACRKKSATFLSIAPKVNDSVYFWPRIAWYNSCSLNEWIRGRSTSLTRGTNFLSAFALSVAVRLPEW